VAARYFRRVYGVLIVVPGIFLEPGVVHNNSLFVHARGAG
jgi:hypothetical protein